MFWKKKNRKPSCDHFWHHLQDDYIFIDRGACVDAEDGAWIFCSKCQNEKLVYVGEWRRINRKQEILANVSHSEQTTQ